MNARYYVPSLGRFASADTLVPNPTDPQQFNRFSYVLNNPIRLTDPSGHCPAPTGTSGQVICISLFISTETIAWGFGYGDNRGFNSNSDPDQSRAYLYLNVDASGALVDQDLHVNASCIIIGCFGPFLEYDTFKATQLSNGDIEIEWALLNGVSGAFRDLSDTIYEAEAEIGSLAIGSSIVYGMSTPLPAINGSMILRQNAQGQYQVDSFQRDPYPSLEAYSYQNGVYDYTLAQLPQYWVGPTLGLNPLTRNEYYNHPTWWSTGYKSLNEGSVIYAQ